MNMISWTQEHALQRVDDSNLPTPVYSVLAAKRVAAHGLVALGRTYFKVPASAYLALAEALAPLLPYRDRRPTDTSPGGGATREWSWYSEHGRVEPFYPSFLPGGVFARLPMAAPSALTGLPRPRGVYTTERDAMLALLAAVSPKESDL